METKVQTVDMGEGRVAVPSIAAQATKEAAPGAPPVVAPVTPEQAKLFAGKYKSPEELETAYQNAEKALGERSTEIGETRKVISALARQNEILAQTMASARTTQAAPERTVDPQQAYDAAVDNIQKRLDAGEIDYGQAFKEATRLNAEQASRVAVTQAQGIVENMRREQNSASIYSKFVSENPDFEQLRDSGALQPIIQSNPMHDPVSAYYVYKSMETLSAKEAAAKEAYERGRAEAAAIAKGTEQTKAVLAQPGTTVREVNPQKPNKMPTSAELRETGMATLARLRGAAG